MTFSRSIRRFAALAAAFAVTLQALWPLISHARPRGPSVLVPVCTVDGITHYLDLKIGKTPLDERTALHGEHCKMCVFGDSKHIAVVAQGFTPFQFENSSKQSSDTPKASFHQATLHPAQPRAPPSFS